MFLLSKLLPLFVLPLGVSPLLLLWELARHRWGFIWMGVAVLLVSRNPFMGQSLIRSVEEWADRRSVLETPAVDAIVVLSADRVVAPGRERASEWGDADRFFWR